MLLEWCRSAVGVMSEWCRSAVEVVSEWCRSAVAVVSRQKGVMSECCKSAVRVVLGQRGVTSEWFQGSEGAASCVSIIRLIWVSSHAVLSLSTLFREAITAAFCRPDMPSRDFARSSGNELGGAWTAGGGDNRSSVGETTIRAGGEVEASGLMGICSTSSLLIEIDSVSSSLIFDWFSSNSSILQRNDIIFLFKL